MTIASGTSRRSWRNGTNMKTKTPMQERRNNGIWRSFFLVGLAIGCWPSSACAAEAAPATKNDIPANPRDTWAVEQSQRKRIDALLKVGRSDDALAAAKALFLVSGIGSTQYCIHKLAECFKAANPRDSSIVSTFKLQQLALASSDPALRAKQSKDLGENVLASIPIDPKPYDKAIDALAGKKDYDSLYAKGNLLLLSGRVPEARKAFEAAYLAAPPGELKYATEGLMKVIKAEDLSIGRMNQTILQLRPKE